MLFECRRCERLYDMASAFAGHTCSPASSSSSSVMDVPGGLRPLFIRLLCADSLLCCAVACSLPHGDVCFFQSLHTLFLCRMPCSVPFSGHYSTTTVTKQRRPLTSALSYVPPHMTADTYTVPCQRHRPRPCKQTQLEDRRPPQYKRGEKTRRPETKTRGGHSRTRNTGGGKRRAQRRRRR